jgi:hypothetical protein
MYYFLGICLLIILLTASASAETYYVATDGSEDNDGSILALSDYRPG